MDILTDKIDFFKGTEIKVISTITSAYNGDIRYWLRLDVEGNTISLDKSLIASLKGWAKPLILTLLGPLRNCLQPKILRLSKVIKATLINTGIKSKI
jgi:hypothetical protein